MTSFPDLEPSKVCPGHIPENFVPELGCTIQRTTDTDLNTTEGEALPASQLAFTDRNGAGQEAWLHWEGWTAWFLLTLSGVLGLNLQPPGLAQPPLSHRALKLSLLLFRSRMGEKLPPPRLVNIPWGLKWGRKRKS